VRIEEHNLHGTGPRDHEVYDLPQLDEHDYWKSVTNVPCPVEGCGQTVVWHEAGYVPGYRACMRPAARGGFVPNSIQHRFLAHGDLEHPVLIRD